MLNLHPHHPSSAVRHLLLLAFLPRWLRYPIFIVSAVFFTTYMVLFCLIALHAYHAVNHPATPHADAALILGYRTYQHERLNPCLTGRVDKGLLLANQGVVSALIMSGGRDGKNDAIEAEIMATYARNKGYNGPIIKETRSTSTNENLRFSAPLLKAASFKRITIVSEPYHLWRIKKLAAAMNLTFDFNVSYAAASSQCWTKWGMLSRGALREPLAIMHNAAKGYFYTSQ